MVQGDLFGGGAPEAVQRLRARWGEIVTAGQDNAMVVNVPRVLKWTATKDRQLRKLSGFLEGEFSPLAAAIRNVKLSEGCARLDCSLERLTSHDCERAASLIAGKWGPRQTPMTHQQIREHKTSIEAEARAIVRRFRRAP